MKLTLILLTSLSILFSGCSTTNVQKSRVFVTPLSFVVATRVIGDGKNKDKNIEKIQLAASNIRLASGVLTAGELNKDQFLTIVAGTNVSPELIYLANYLFDIYQVKLSESTQEKTKVASQILLDIAIGLEDAVKIATIKHE